MGFVRPSKKRDLLQQEIDFSSVHTAALSDYLGFQGNGCDCGQASIRSQLRLPLKSNVSNNPKKYPSNETQSHLPPPSSKATKSRSCLTSNPPSHSSPEPTISSDRTDFSRIMIPEPVAEFLEFRVRWLELQPALALLLEKEERLPATTAQIRSTVAGTALESQIAAATAAILLARFTSRPIPELVGPSKQTTTIQLTS
jgi:hypothetical protein